MSVGSNRQADRTNRIVLSVVGGLAVITGTAGLAFSYASSGATRPFADQSRRDWLLANGTVLAMAGAALIVVLAALALAWLRYQFQPIEPAGDTTVTRGEDGTTVLRTAALIDTVEAELVALRGVAAATARIRADDTDTIDIILDIDQTADLVRIAQEARQQVLARARRATGREGLTLALESRFGTEAASSRAV